MTKIYGRLEKESREVGLGDDSKLDCEIRVGSAEDSKGFVDAVVTKGEKDFKTTIRVHGDREVMLHAEKNNDSVIVKSLIRELKDWLIDCEYEDMFWLLEELKGLEATLDAYLEDLYRIEDSREDVLDEWLK